MLQELKQSVELKFGRKISSQKDCKLLSESIISITKQVISASTLRRVFGFLKTNSNPSRVTLNILSQYCGFSNWDDFKEKNEVITTSKEPIFELWEKAKKSAQSISEKHCSIVKKQNPLGFNNIVTRNFAQERLAYFISSKYTATSFIGPGGYGKSTLLVDWFERQSSLPSAQNNILLFLPATALESWIGKELFIDDWLSLILSIKSLDFFETLGKMPQIASGKFIIILDALDEIALNSAKTEKIYHAVHQLVSHLPHVWFKLIISSRYSTWQHFANLSPSLEHWYFVSKEVFSQEGANMPPLNEEEIQGVIDNTINAKKSSRFLTEELPYDLQQIISYPYYLQIFIEIFSPNLSHVVTDKLDLLQEFLKKQIYQGQYPDEKSDILNCLIDLSVNEKAYALIKKNDLKQRYPIHLKTEGNYYNAYHQLVSFGIISEEMLENQFGSLTNMVKISQIALYELLTLQQLVEKNGGIDFKLFLAIEKRYENSFLLADLISMLFHMAYKNKQVDVLKPFFTLSDSTLKTVLELPNIHHTIKDDDYMRRELIPLYATKLKARKYLFESFINLNTIAQESRLLILNYLQHTNSNYEQFLGKTMLFISNAYGLDFNWTKNFNNEFSINEPPLGTPPLFAGLWYSCALITNFINGLSDERKLLENIELFIQKNSANWTGDCTTLFELGLFFGLLTSRQYQEIYTRLEMFFKHKPSGAYTSVEKTLAIYYEYTKWRVLGKFDDHAMQKVQSYLGEIPAWISYQTFIIAKSWLAMYYLTQGEMNKSLNLFQKSLEISNMAGYTIFEVKLLKNLSPVLLSMGEKEKASETDLLAMNLAKDSNIDFKLL